MSIEMRSKLNAQKQATWRIEVRTGLQKDGKYGRIRETFFGTKQEAKEKELEMKLALKRNEYIMQSNVRLEEFVPEWLNHVKLHKAPKTYKNYKHLMECYVLPEIGHMELKDIKTPTVQKLLDNLMARDYSVCTTRKVKAIMSGAFGHAVRLELLRHNPVSSARVTSKQRVQKVTRESVWTVEQVNAILSSCREEHYWIYFWVGLYTGMRPQEIYSLRWRNVDLDRKTITVIEALQANDKDGVLVGDTKNEGSVRTIPIEEELIRQLKKHKAEQSEAKLLLGTGYNDAGLVVANPFGRTVNDKQLRKVIGRVAEKAGVPYLPQKNFRHTHATLMLQAKVPVKVVSERLGHATTSITQDIYSFALPSMQEDAIRAFEQQLNQK